MPCWTSWALHDDPLLKVAIELEKIALQDEYFIEKKLYPNIDFYSGITLKALGFPTSMFTVLFALARTVGWIAQWKEMMEDPHQKIGRPRQIYTGRRPSANMCRWTSGSSLRHEVQQRARGAQARRLRRPRPVRNRLRPDRATASAARAACRRTAVPARPPGLRGRGLRLHEFRHGVAVQQDIDQRDMVTRHHGVASA